jgi:hypothetical protein
MRSYADGAAPSRLSGVLALHSWVRYLPVTFVSVAATLFPGPADPSSSTRGLGRIPPNGASLMVAPTGDPQRYWGESRLRTGTQARRALPARTRQLTR